MAVWQPRPQGRRNEDFTYKQSGPRDASAWAQKSETPAYCRRTGPRMVKAETANFGRRPVKGKEVAPAPAPARRWVAFACLQRWAIGQQGQDQEDRKRCATRANGGVSVAMGARLARRPWAGGKRRKKKRVRPSLSEKNSEVVDALRVGKLRKR